MKSPKCIRHLILFAVCSFQAYAQTTPSDSSLIYNNIISIESGRVLKSAGIYLTESPITITEYPAPRSAGGLHDFYSEGDYWWPDPENPDGPYIQRDGLSNPDNFTAHRKAMIRLSVHTAALTAAYLITSERKYADKAIEHFHAWFVNPKTRMNPSLLYAQAINGRFTGRGIGIIDTIHLIEVARSVYILDRASLIEKDTALRIKDWFRQYLTWLTSHQYGIDEMNAKNNHGTCWVMQAAAFAHLTGDEQILDMCRKRFKEILLPGQLAYDGSFPLELKRTKPYNYSLFNLDAFFTLLTILSTQDDNLWLYKTEDGRNIYSALKYMAPYIRDKSLWPYTPDVMYYEFYPVRHPALLFGALAYNNPEYLAVWKTLNADPENEEVIRNFPIRQPLLWLDFFTTLPTLESE